MMKMRLLTVILLILSAVGAATAAEVINVDLNGYNSKVPYVGNGAYDVGDDAVWTVFYGGFGVPVGSKNSEGLSTDVQGLYYDSVYAAQVWLGDDGLNHTYQYGSGLMDDGFVANEGASPKINIFGQGAYQGVYDIYVYGRDAGSFTLNQNGVTTTQTVTGGVAAGEFVEGGNYVIFSNVDVNNSDSALLTLTYTNKLNGLQLVKKKDPVSVGNGTRIKAGNWDIAGERNAQDGEQEFGPDTWPDATDTNDPNRIAGTVLPGEFMSYNITINDINAGDYNVAVEVNTAGQYPLGSLALYLDGRFINFVKYNKISPPTGDTNAITVNLVPGSHTISWQLPFSVGTYGTNIVAVKFTRLGDIVINNCGDVRNYGLTLAADLVATDTNSTPDCGVNIYDIDALASNWLKQ